MMLQAGQALYAELAANDNLFEEVTKVLARQLGHPLPRLHCAAAPDLSPRDVRLVLAPDDPSDSDIWPGLPAGTLLVADTLFRVQRSLGRADPPATVERWPPGRPGGGEAVLVHGRLKAEIAQRFSPALIYDPVEYALAICIRQVRRDAHRLIDRRVTAWLMGSLPASAAAALLRGLGVDGLLPVLRRLASENISLIDFPAFAPSLATPECVAWFGDGIGRAALAALPGFAAVPAPPPADLDDQRNRAARSIAVPLLLRRRAAAGALPVWTLAGSAGLALPDDPAWNAALAERVEVCARAEGVLLVPDAQRAALWQRLRGFWPELLVVSPHEIPRAVPVRDSQARLTLPDLDAPRRSA